MNRELVAIDGAAELDRRLSALGSSVATEIGEQALREGAEVFQEAWVRAAPFDPRAKVKSWRTKSGAITRRAYGHLRQNIKVKRLDSSRATVLRYMVITGKAFWGYFVDRGTVKMRARPWATAAAESAMPAAVDRIGEVLRDGVEQNWNAHG